MEGQILRDPQGSDPVGSPWDALRGLVPGTASPRPRAKPTRASWQGAGGRGAISAAPSVVWGLRHRPAGLGRGLGEAGGERLASHKGASGSKPARSREPITAAAER